MEGEKVAAIGEPTVRALEAEGAWGVLEMEMRPVGTEPVEQFAGKVERPAGFHPGRSCGP